MPAPSARAGPSRLPPRRVAVSESENDSDGGGATPSPRRRRTNGQSAPNGHANGNGRDVTPAEEEDSLEAWTVDTFESRPVPKSGATSGALRAVEDKLRDVMKRIQDGLEKIQDAAKAIEDAQEGDPMVDELDVDFKRMLEMREEIQIKLAVLDELEAELRADGQIMNAEEQYKERAEVMTTEYKAKSERAKFKGVSEYVDFRTAIWEMSHPDEACPPISRWLLAGEGDSDDSDIEVGGTTQNYRCHITLRPYVDPVTSIKCRHSYSRAAIEEMINRVPGRTKQVKCPSAGCKQIITHKDLQANPTLAKKTAEYVKRQEQQLDEREDDGDVVDFSQI